MKQINDNLYRFTKELDKTGYSEIQFASYKFKDGVRTAITDGVDPVEVMKVCMERLNAEKVPDVAGVSALDLGESAFQDSLKEAEVEDDEIDEDLLIESDEDSGFEEDEEPGDDPEEILP